MTPKAIVKVDASLKRDYDVPMYLPGNVDWDIYSTVNEPNAPSTRTQEVEVEDDGFNMWDSI